MIKVSVILTTYNLQDVISETLISIIGQEFHNYEVIIVDDGSTDDTCKIIKKYTEEFKFLKLYEIEHSGAGYARNYGFSKSCWQYVIFLDGDDVFHPALIYEMYKKILNEKADICLCNSCEFRYNTSNIVKWHKNNDFYPVGWAWDKMIKRSLIEEYDLKFCNLTSSNDLSFSYAAWFLAKTKTQVNMTLVKRRLREGSVSENRNEENAFLALVDLKGKLIKANHFEQFKNDFYNIAEMFIYDFYSLSEKSAKTDVGGVDFVHPDALENFLKNAQDTFYKYVESNLYGERNQQLPTVSEITIESCTETEYVYGEKKSEKAYEVKVNWTYTEETYSDYQSSTTLIFVKEGIKYYLVELQ